LKFKAILASNYMALMQNEPGLCRLIPSLSPGVQTRFLRPVSPVQGRYSYDNDDIYDADCHSPKTTAETSKEGTAHKRYQYDEGKALSEFVPETKIILVLEHFTTLHIIGRIVATTHTRFNKR
jgi:hypothetical protein